MGQRTSGIYLMKREGFNLIASYCDMETIVGARLLYNEKWMAKSTLIGIGTLTKLGLVYLPMDFGLAMTTSTS